MKYVCSSKSRGGKCLSKKYVNKETHLKWECSEGHVWKAKPGDVKYQNTWCMRCSGKLKLTISEMRRMAEERGGKCLSKNSLAKEMTLSPLFGL